MLIDYFKSDYVRLIRTRVDDGEGGTVSQWVESGDPFRAAVVCDSSNDVTEADKQALTRMYTITSNERFMFHDVIKRVHDGAIYRVLSDSVDEKTPSCASFSFMNAKCERWELS